MKNTGHYIILAVLALVAASAFVMYTGSQTFTARDVATLNRMSSYSPEELKIVCEKMSRNSHLSVVTDGAYLPFGGRTYYYRSACFMELARQTRDPRICDNVSARLKWLNGDSGFSKERCLRVISELNARESEDAAHSAADRATVAKAMTLTDATISSTAPGHWHLQISTSGALPGLYEIEIVSTRDKQVLLKVPFEISDAKSTSRWDIETEALPKCLECGAAQSYPIAFSLRLIKEKNGTTLTSPLLINALTKTISTGKP